MNVRVRHSSIVIYVVVVVVISNFVAENQHASIDHEYGRRRHRRLLVRARPFAADE